MILKLEIAERDIILNWSKCKKNNVDGNFIQFNTVNVINANALSFNYDEYNGIYNVNLITDNDEVIECVELIENGAGYVVIIDLVI